MVTLVYITVARQPTKSSNLLLGNQLTDACAQCLIEGLKNNSSLTSLDLSNNDFGEQGGICLGGALVCTVLILSFRRDWSVQTV